MLFAVVICRFSFIYAVIVVSNRDYCFFLLLNIVYMITEWDSLSAELYFYNNNNNNNNNNNINNNEYIYTAQNRKFSDALVAADRQVIL